MSTHAAIIRKTYTGKFEGVYLHRDGYSSYAGRILQTHYKDADKVAALINLGDLSFLGERVEPIGSHSFGSAEKGTTIAYGRDRGERNVGKLIADSISELESEIDHSGNVYVFADGEWSHNGQPIEVNA
jgi:hypothetical protein